MVRSIVFVPSPILRKQARPVKRFTAALERVVSDMFETMHAAHGVGLAAPQIGLSVRIAIIHRGDTRLTLINPVILSRSERELMQDEMCLSIPGIMGLNVPRAASVKVQAQRLDGEFFTVTLSDMLARIAQHEIDHLNGILFPDRLTSSRDLRVAAQKAS
jgi:peptide deformylase